MRPASVLLAQIDSTVNSIAQASDRLKSGQLDSGLLKRIQARFENNLNRSMQKVTALRESVRQLPAEASLEIAWAQHDGLRREAETVISECLAFMGGALTRAHGIDFGLCRLTDAMLYDLSARTDVGWNRFTIVADGEFFARLSGIIRIQFPDVSIWNLPVAAHEFGHFVASGWKESALAGMIEREKRADRRYEAYLNEHFADLFATFTVGPCFAMVCGLVRFSPASAVLQSDTHPSAAQRMWWILETLRSIDKSRPGPPLYDYITQQLEQSWTASLKAASQEPGLSADDTLRLRGWLAEMLEAVKLNFSAGQYRGWLRAQEMAESFLRRHLPELAKNDRIPDVLNAVWLCRSQQEPADGYQVTWLAESAFKLCDSLVGAADEV